MNRNNDENSFERQTSARVTGCDIQYKQGNNTAIGEKVALRGERRRQKEPRELGRRKVVSPIYSK